jgi:polar amino acid transport system substrate-binding protein
MTRLFVCAVSLALIATIPAARAADPEAAKAVAPDGTLHAAINYGNPVLAQRTPPDGAPHGVSAELARELGRRLGVPVQFVLFDEAGATAEAVKRGAWDVAFLAVDPVRTADIGFTPPYVEIEGTYLVPATSPLQSPEQVDAAGVRIAVAKGSAYDLYLTRALRHAELVRFDNTAASIDGFATRHLDALAGVRQPLVAMAAAHPEWRVMAGRFMRIDQAMGVPAQRKAALAYTGAFIQEMKASGFVARALAASGQSAATVAGPAAGQ